MAALAFEERRIADLELAHDSPAGRAGGLARPLFSPGPPGAARRAIGGPLGHEGEAGGTTDRRQRREAILAGAVPGARAAPPIGAVEPSRVARHATPEQRDATNVPH